MEQLIEQAKKLIAKRWDEGRKWLETSLDSYGDKSYRVSLFVLEGSPAKGYIIANYGMGRVTAFGCDGTRLKTYRL
ncbi:MAG: hypothetical protein DYG83_03405 [Candidatus Brocadia sp. AMX2]|uniref:Uncharacterized protein n=1 Tax=Candidatus Brocadia sinica JPN1 TaxID=1197129 RepID=A0ABQ0JZH6_9BACT|nr:MULTISPECIES: hypothetical protein [Brocadia]MBC6931286.1 hypothetical protein [Candidatus Brocadia sp.]MBL1168542.1 hypothetical protein [Candidatus Brocadia sp. AMX1]MCK6467197.1 putative porin [Candidatus Brocadia sinica]NOG40077.1 hypothetical protein [Planctomycetota bacterium]KAA0246015.1 MAG: hypothetical protein EDM70_00020 [Candidatus Brocadia sp. AMX2]